MIRLITGPQCSSIQKGCQASGEMNYEKISLDCRERWVDVLKEINHSFFHTWDCVYSIAEFNKQAAYLYVSQLNDSLILVPVLERYSRGHLDYLSPYGYAGLLSVNLTPEHISSFSEAMKGEGVVCSYLTLNPILSDKRLFAADCYYRRNVSYVVDLRSPVNHLYKNLGGRKRSQVKLKGEDKFVEECGKLVDAFVDLIDISMERRRVKDIYRFDRGTLLKLCAAERTFLLGVESRGQIVAVTLCGWANGVADFLLNGSTEEGRKYSAALLWKSMLYFQEKGVTFFNLGGGMSEGDGLARFKSDFGGETFEFGALKIVHNIDVYRNLCEETGVDHLDKSGFFPAYAKLDSPVE
jgi:hypothetical protein